MSSIKNEIKIIKSGIFYNVYEEDVYIFNLLLNYKINIALKTGFSEKPLTKVVNTLEDAKISYSIFEKNDVVACKDFGKLNNYKFKKLVA